MLDEPRTTEPFAIIREAMPVACVPLALAGRTAGLIVVDEVKGFAMTGAGALAPPLPNAQVAQMIEETDRLARRFVVDDRPVLAFLDTHQPGTPEPPYPPHCEAGSGEENLIDELIWLERSANTTFIRKDCINGFVGAIDPTTTKNRLIDWVSRHRLDTLVVVGICTDICVMDFVLTMLSARNHGLTPGLRDIAVYEPGCATYDLPTSTALAIGLPETATHPQAIAHHLGLYFMAARGAILASRID